MDIKLRLNKNTIFLWLALIAFWPPECVKQLIPHGDFLLKIISSGVGMLVIIFYFSINKLTKLFWVVVFFYGWMVIDTVFHWLPITSILVDGIKVIGICCLSEMYIEKKGICFLKNVLKFLSIYIVLNAVTMYFYPNGLWTTEYTTEGKYYFLGYENNIILTVMPAIVIAIYLRENRISVGLINWIAVLLGIITIIYTGCSTAIMMLLIFAAFMIVSNLNLVKRLINRWTIMGGSIVLFVGIVIWRVQENFAELFESLLNRDISFTLRTYIWTIFLNLCMQSPIVGYGCEPSETILSKVNSMSNIRLAYAKHAHDLFLDITYKGGLFGLSLWLIIMFLVLKNVKNLIRKKECICMLAAVIAYFIAFVVEPYSYMLQLFYLILTVFCYSGNMINEF